MPCEITVKLKDRAKTLTKKKKVLEDVKADMNDPAINELLCEATKNFGSNPGNMSVTIKLLEGE